MKAINQALFAAVAVFSFSSYAEGNQEAKIYFETITVQRQKMILKRMVSVELKSYIAGRAASMRESSEQYSTAGPRRTTWPVTFIAGDCPSAASIACEVNIIVEVMKHSTEDKFVCKQRTIDPEIVYVTQKQVIKWKLFIYNGTGFDKIRFSVDKDDFMVVIPPYAYREFHPKMHGGNYPDFDSFQITDNHSWYPHPFNYQFELDYAHDGVKYERCTGIDPIIFNS